MVKTWMIDDLLPHAEKAYTELGIQLGIAAISKKRILDFFPTPQMRDVFMQHIENKDHYFQPFPEENDFTQFFHYNFGCGEIHPAYTVHLETVLPAWRKILIKNRQLLQEDFDISHLSVEKNQLAYKEIKAEKIIFCDGISSTNHPWFQLLPFARNKGEALVLEIPELSKEYIYKKGYTLAPLADQDLFWLGSSYQWAFTDARPSKEFFDAATSFLRSWLKMPFRVLDHKAAIRPATLERRPFVGFHPLHPQIGILNGMGTKGCSLAPFFAKQLTGHLLHQTPILPEAAVNRFRKILQRS
jgi:glycine/D-amino acid oxidase-like deaminating enzyme